jgi:hypothetical protein
LEAAHIWPYRGEQDHHPDNGLLLRADIHTLFDLDFIAVEPEKLVAFLAPPLMKVAAYTPLHGRQLFTYNASRPSQESLMARWAVFQKKWCI